ncbi:tricarballylate utilization 4Fe-4S protein TcuB [Paraburkholderia phymatum]|uniref:Tricarballylate utilization 4Fe-4S protein TcuB n=1 Tax=Paraburkholderia phymatum TaxID=148447 RepID=A0ACC6U4E1_9BURK
MQPLEILIRDAQAAADGSSFTSHAAPEENEVARILRICNACRYCEGFCAVFPAMTRRLEFGDADVHYLANLCHNCGACLHACQYAPPHEFAVNVPQAMARVRLRTYRLYAWPGAFGRLYEHNGVVVSLALAAGVALFLILVLALRGTLWGAAPGGRFYDVFPHALMVGVFGPVFLFAVCALGVGVRRFWREMTPGTVGAAEAAEAGAAVATLRYLGGGHGDGCNDEDDRFSLARRRFHQATFYGFLLCFLSTSVATLYHYLFGLEAPYAYTSLPVLLGIAGGVGIAVGTPGLGWLNLRRHPLQGDARQNPVDRGFTALLFFIAVSGFALSVWRASAAMPLLLAVHLGMVIALFLTLPYGKFAHGPLRAAALLRWAIERRQPDHPGLADDS